MNIYAHIRGMLQKSIAFSNYLERCLKLFVAYFLKHFKVILKPQ